MFATLRRSVGGLIASPPKPTPSEASAQQSPSRTTSAPASSSTSSSSSSSTVFVYLVLENSQGDVKAEYPIRKQSTKIGRLHTNDIRIYTEYVSRVHCEVRCSTEEPSQATLHVLNPSNVRINGRPAKKLIEEDETHQRTFELRDGDLISIHRNAFRVRYPAVARESSACGSELGEDTENVAPPSRSPRKALRMSLVRAAIVDTPSKRAETSSASSNKSPERMPLESLKGVQQQAVDSTTSAPPKRRRQSLVFATPKRPSQPRATPWTAEPSKRGTTKQAAPKSLPDASNWSDVVETKEKHVVHPADKEDSVVVLEEMEDVVEGDDIALARNAQEQGDAPSLVPWTPSPTKQSDRLTQSSSPKKAKRRSSFFGRAGVFANWNFGFYPEERKAARESNDGDCSLADEDLSESPDGLPEPRLDEHGRPRLPRSLSSPAGLRYSSPPKRRVVSLRTATLLKQGQNAFEQRKLRSPSSSPTKIGASRLHESTISIMAAVEEMKSNAEGGDRESADVAEVDVDSDDARASSSKNLDDDDADEVDRSLSLLDEDQGEEKVELGRPYKARTGRTSDSMATKEEQPKRSKARASLPAKLVSIAFVEGGGECAHLDVEQLKSQWLAEQANEEASPSDGDGNASAHESDTDSEFGGEGEEVQEKEAHTPPMTPSSGVKYGMLRYLVRDDADLTALLDAQARDEVAKEAAQDASGLAEVSEEKDALDMSEAPVEESCEAHEIDAGWQVVSPRRGKWKPNATTTNRRMSETDSRKQSQESERPRVGKRRITAAPSLASAASEVRVQEPIEAGVVVEEASGGADDTPRTRATSQSPTKRSMSPDKSIVQSPAKRSTSSLSPQKSVHQSPAKRSSSPQKEMHQPAAEDAPVQEKRAVSGEVSPSKRRRRRDVEEAVADSESPMKGVNVEEEALCTRGARKANLKTPSPAKKVRAKRSAQSLRKPLQLTSDNAVIQMDDDEEEYVKVVSMQPSSPTLAKTRRKRTATKPSRSVEAASTVSTKSASDAALPAVKTSHRRAAVVRDAQSETTAAPAVVATTRSGRAVRKPADLKQPATVVQSDPIRSSERVTRGRAKKS